ncbi:uncharacterized protein EDB91DRAFT_1086794 [Suillus paluster]|uniref:uncharacterized protein n=1 Tax=Suillus paluster TaxID=48578 RepID=UPI001B877EC9|nr:uncharacterized protein EDB91DRAFT_1086794 [Suillus paluster]KAG1726448.1 hypothetical protein EDB91DRAFT_1086794 [Suillus paluster]
MPNKPEGSQEVRQTGHGRKAGGNGGGVRSPTGGRSSGGRGGAQTEGGEEDQGGGKMESSWQERKREEEQKQRDIEETRRRVLESASLGRMGVSMSVQQLLKVRRNLAAPVWSIRGTVPGLRRLGPTGRSAPAAFRQLVSTRRRSGSERRGPHLPRAKGKKCQQSLAEMDDDVEVISNPQTVIAEEGRWTEYNDQAWVATANNIVVALARTNGLLEQSIAVVEGSRVAMDRFSGGAEGFPSLIPGGGEERLSRGGWRKNQRKRRWRWRSEVFGDTEVWRSGYEVDWLSTDRTPEVLDKFPGCRGNGRQMLPGGTKACGTKSTARELKELMAAVRIVEERKAAEAAEQAKRAEEARIAAAVERARLAEEARKVAEVRRSGVSEAAPPVVMCQQCEATGQACTWALVQEDQAKSKSRGRAKAKACDQCAGLKASCKVDGDDSQLAVPAKSWKRTWEWAAESGERMEEDVGRPSQRRRVYGEEESITEVDDQEWVKAANDMVLVQAEMNTKLGALATAITHLTKQLELQQVEQKEERNKVRAEIREILHVTGIALERGFLGRGKKQEVLGKRGEIGMGVAEVTELTTSSSGSDTEKPDEESESEAEKGLDGEETGAQPELEQSRRKRWRWRPKCS